VDGFQCRPPSYSGRINAFYSQIPSYERKFYLPPTKAIQIVTLAFIQNRHHKPIPLSPACPRSHSPSPILPLTLLRHHPFCSPSPQLPASPAPPPAVVRHSVSNLRHLLSQKRRQQRMMAIKLCHRHRHRLRCVAANTRGARALSPSIIRRPRSANIAIPTDLTKTNH
jgi:hypothetical protein